MSDRVKRWLGWQEIMKNVDWGNTSALGVAFLNAAKPPHPVEQQRLDNGVATLVQWSDGVVETVDHLDLR